MNPVLAHVLATGSVQAGDGRVIPLHSHVSPDEGAWIQGVIRDVGATTTLEVGLAFGVSALFICDALSTSARARHIVIDPAQLSPSWDGIGLLNLERAGYIDIVEFHPLDSSIALPQLVSLGLEIDFAFIDGGHVFDQVLVDFFYVDRLLRIGGAVAFDDADWPSIAKVCRFVSANRAYSLLGPGSAAEVFSDGADAPLPTRFVAFRKLAHDGRRCDFHRTF